MKIQKEIRHLLQIKLAFRCKEEGTTKPRHCCWYQQFSVKGKSKSNHDTSADTDIFLWTEKCKVWSPSENDEVSTKKIFCQLFQFKSGWPRYWQILVLIFRNGTEWSSIAIIFCCLCACFLAKSSPLKVTGDSDHRGTIQSRAFYGLAGHRLPAQPQHMHNLN